MNEQLDMDANQTSARHTLRSRPETVVWGYLSPHVPPVLRIRSGDTVDIDTVNPVGILGPGETPEAFFADHGMPLEQAGQDLADIMSTVQRDVGPHILTGPIHVQDAQPGDVLEVRVLDLQARAPHYGVNFSLPGTGGLPDLLTEPWQKVVPFDMQAGLASFSPDIDIPLAPFMGTMGVAPTEKVSSIPPGRFGGNIDLKYLTVGSRLYLPVLVEGGLFFTGDGHGAQGNGEANLTALETSLSGSFQFVLHKNCPRAWPLAETAEHYFALGLDIDLDEAARIALEQCVGAISAYAGVSVPEAYALCSLLVDFEVTQIVDGVKGVHGKIAKKRFRKVARQWWGPAWPERREP